VALGASGCFGGSSSNSGAAPPTSTTSYPKAKTLPAKGTVQLPDGRVYTVAAAGTPLRLDDIRVVLRSLRWEKSVGATVSPPGTRIFAVAKLVVQNLGTSSGTITATQFWLLDGGGQEYLSEGHSDVPDPLVGRRVEAGASVSGTLVFPTPVRFSSGTLLVYRFADAAAIARAKHVGILRLG
jgi:Domain of unknown function (DUF4352)